jgi:hypothetical protein
MHTPLAKQRILYHQLAASGHGCVR